ncbi:MAG: hypothetical protein HQ541_18420, partial [Mariniphaga sp.]|nr:hypothetical protein [Mariniphaga sp.]
IGLYLFNNYLKTGYLTGMLRNTPREVPVADYIFSLIKTIATELNFLSNNPGLSGLAFLLLEAVIFAALIYRNREIIFDKANYISDKNIHSLSLVFLLVGISYYLIIIFIYGMLQITALGYRELAPGTLLIFIALINYIEIRTHKNVFTVFRRALISLSVLSWLATVPVKTYIKYGGASYHATVDDVSKKYSIVPPNSIVVFGINHLRYLRTDIELRRPYSSNKPEERESWSNFIDRIQQNNTADKDIYLVIPPEKFYSDTFDSSVASEVEKHLQEPGGFIKLN